MPKKNVIEKVSDSIPDILTNVLGYFKNNFEENTQDILENANGTAGIIIKLFAKPLIDGYFEKLSDKKLDNFGFDTYLKASFKQASKSLESISDSLDDNFSDKLFIKAINDSFTFQLESLDKTNMLLIFQPLYHPAVVFVKSSYMSILEGIGVKPSSITAFQKDYNENIEKSIVEAFGNDYNKHLDLTNKFRLKESETKLLWDTLKLNKIGFQENEHLKYMPTLAYWEKIGNIYNPSGSSDPVPIENLIEEYFSIDPDNHLRKILFIVSDFGKGKSVFFRNYASQLAENYLKTGEGEFPVYFNLRNYGKYNSDSHLGVINDFLISDYRINIEDEHFKKKNYVFLIDSLDESGELSNHHIHSVIQSIKKIQQTKERHIYSRNKLLITSRPVNVGLESHITNNSPFLRKNISGVDEDYYIALNGFSKSQFNEWIYDSLSNTENGLKSLENLNINIKNKDLCKALSESDTLSYRELERPIFAYMIYKLIINDFDFLKVGKIGVYLSFINLLTSSAKHINDKDYKISLKEEYEFRNILHISSILWMREKQKGQQGCLKKADICRVLDGYNRNETDAEVLDRYKDVKEIQFLSNSYFGEEKDTLVFQHQSFAEILLAEYYLKVFIKYALEDNQTIEDARVKLILGEPTEQTVAFFSELLTLLRNSCEEGDHTVDETRKLLFPFMASLGTKKNNTLFSNEIYYDWFRKHSLDRNDNNFPEEAISNWCISKSRINNIVELSAYIINSKTEYLSTKVDTRSSLYDNELIVFPNTSTHEIVPDIDRWLSLIAGTRLYDKEDSFFLTDRKVGLNQLLKMMNNWSHYTGYSVFGYGFTHKYEYNDVNNSIPEWSKFEFSKIIQRAYPDDSINNLLTILSHEIRTPLNAIYGLFELLHDKKIDLNSFPEDIETEDKEMIDFLNSARIRLIQFLKQPVIETLLNNQRLAENVLDLDSENYRSKADNISNFIDSFYDSRNK